MNNARLAFELLILKLVLSGRFFLVLSGSVWGCETSSFLLPRSLLRVSSRSGKELCVFGIVCVYDVTKTDSHAVDLSLREHLLSKPVN